MLYLYLATGGFILLGTGIWSSLAFLDRPLQRFARWLLTLRPRAFLLLVSGTMFLITNLISYFVFEHMPHIQDSIAQLFQARIWR